MSDISKAVKEEILEIKEEPRKITLGEQRVRILFNPSNTSDIDTIKSTSAAEINKLEAMRLDSGVPVDSEKQRLISLSQTAFEEAAMWAVKAITFNKN